MFLFLLECFAILEKAIKFDYIGFYTYNQYKLEILFLMGVDMNYILIKEKIRTSKKLVCGFK
jgi:hypothetical protein